MWIVRLLSFARIVGLPDVKIMKPGHRSSEVYFNNWQGGTLLYANEAIAIMSLQVNCLIGIFI